MTSDCLNTETKPFDMVGPATVNVSWNIVKNKKERVRDPSAKVTASNSSWRDPSAKVIVQFVEKSRKTRKNRRETPLSESWFRAVGQLQ